MMKYRSRWVASLLTLLCMGFGQIYNGQFLKGAIFIVVNLLLEVLAYHFGIVTSFHGLVAFFAAGLVVAIVAWVDALRNSGCSIQLKNYNRWYVYALLYCALFGGDLLFFDQSFIGSSIGIRSFKIPGASMEPTIDAGDRMIVDVRKNAHHSLQRGDVIVFLYPQDKNKQFVKRLVGLPGEHIRTQGNDLYLNDEKLPHSVITSDQDAATVSEVLGDHHYSVQYLTQHIYPDREYVVPNGQLFVMGDNRDNSADSRDWGFVPMNDVLGKAAYIYWSHDHSRIGQPLQ